MKPRKCEDCFYCDYHYNIIYQRQYNKCKHPKNTSGKYCDIIRDPNFDIVSTYYNSCGSFGKYFRAVSKSEKIRKHLVNGIFMNPPIWAGGLFWLFFTLL